VTSSRHPVRRNHILSSLLKLQRFLSSSVYYCSILCAQSADTRTKSKKNDKSLGDVLQVQKPPMLLPQQKRRAFGTPAEGLKRPKARSFGKNGAV